MGYFLFSTMVSTCSPNDDSTQEMQTPAVTPDPPSLESERVDFTPVFDVQVAAFQVRSNAQRLIPELDASQLRAFVTTDCLDSVQVIYRVRLGPYPREDDAEEVLNEVHLLGYHEAYIMRREAPAVEQSGDSTTVVEKTPHLDFRQLTFEGECRAPRWSPTGREIAFFKRENEDTGIYTVGTGGGSVSRIIESDQSRQITDNFGWSPTASQIAFVAHLVVEFKESAESLFLVNKDGSGLKSVLKQDYAEFNFSDLHWSPDGKHLAVGMVREESFSKAGNIQRVSIVSFETLAFGQNRERVWDISRYGEVPFLLEKSSRPIGWRNRTEFLSLSTFDRLNDSTGLAYEIWSYDIESGDTETVWLSEATKEWIWIGLVLEMDVAVFADSAQIIAVLLESGEQVALDLDAEPHGLISFVTVAADRVFYRIDQEVWWDDLLGSRLNLGAQFNSYYFSISPNGGRICFAEGGTLFTLKTDVGQ